MQPRIEPMRRPPLLMVQGGHDGRETVEGLELAQRLGATGLATAIHLTTDGGLLVRSTHSLRVGLRRKRLDLGTTDEAPESVLRFADLHPFLLGGGTTLFHVRDQLTAGATVAALRDLESTAGRPLLPQVWFAHGERGTLAEWRPMWPEARLVEWTRLERLSPGPEKVAADLGSLGIDAIGMHQTDWTGGLTTLFHRFGVQAISDDCQLERIIAEQLGAGVDAVISNFADRLASGSARFDW